MNQEIKKWIDMAEMDYGVAKHLYETYYPKPYDIHPAPQALLPRSYHIHIPMPSHESFFQNPCVLPLHSYHFVL